MSLTTITIKRTTQLEDRLALLKKIALGNDSKSSYPRAIKLDKKYMLHAANATMSVSFKLSSSEMGIISEPIEDAFLLPITAVDRLLDSSYSDELSIAYDKKTVKVQDMNKKSRKSECPAMDINSFPAIKSVDTTTTVKVESEAFLKAIKQTSFAASDNNTKPLHCCTHLISDKEKLSVYTCDGYKSALITFPCTTETGFQLSVPRNAINILSSLKCSDSITIGVTSGKQAFFLVDSQTIVRCQLCEGNIIAPDKIFKENENVIKVNAKEITLCLKTMKSLIDKCPACKIVIEDGTLSLSYDGQSKCYDEFSYKVVSSNDTRVEIGANVSFLSDSIKCIDEEEVYFTYKDSITPLLLKNKDGNTSALVVPYRLNG